MSQSPTPVSYVPAPGGALSTASQAYVSRELQKISESIRSILLLTPQVAAKAPLVLVDGMQRLAVAPWRPVSGQTADRWVTYHGGQWVYSSTL